MKAFAIFATALPAIASATLTYNITEALEPCEFEKYRCLTTENFAARLPKCLQHCQVLAAKGDGCAFDDYACHCVNYDSFSKIIEPCAFPPALGGHGNCSFADLAIARPLVNDMCNFFNATLYADYVGCHNKVSVHKTLGIVFSESTNATRRR